MEKEIEREEQKLKGKEERVKQKIKNTVKEAKRVDAQLQLMAGKLDQLAHQILEETKK